MAAHENLVDALILSNLGKDYDQEATIQDLVESTLDQDVRVKTYRELSGKALVILESQVDFHDAAEKLQREDEEVCVDKPQLNGLAVVVRNLTCDAPVNVLSEESLEMYFCTQFGDGEKIVQSCNMHQCNGNSFVAFVKFHKDSGVVREVLKCAEHVPLPSENYKVLVEPCYTNFDTLLEVEFRSGLMAAAESRSIAEEVKRHTKRKEKEEDSGQCMNNGKLYNKKGRKARQIMQKNSALITESLFEDRVKGMSKTHMEFLKHMVTQIGDCQVTFEYQGGEEFHAVFRGREDAVHTSKVDFILELKKIKKSTIPLTKPMKEILSRKTGDDVQRMLASSTKGKGEISFSSNSINIIAFGDDNLSSCEEILKEAMGGCKTVPAIKFPEAEFRSLKDSLELDLQVSLSFEDTKTIMIEGIPADCEEALQRATVRLFTFTENLISKVKISGVLSPESANNDFPQPSVTKSDLSSPEAKDSWDKTQLTSRTLQMAGGNQSLVYQLSKSSSLEIKTKGDITQEVSEILVSLLDKKADLRRTRVGQAFNSACPDLWKNLEKAKEERKSKEIVVSAGPFVGLPSTCQFVYHVVLHRFTPGESEMNLLNIVNNLIKLATRAKQKSIAIPPLGCGRQHGFPETVVAQALIQGLHKSIRGSSLTKIRGSSLTKVVLLSGDERLTNAYKAEADKVFMAVTQGDGSSDAMGVDLQDEEQYKEESPQYVESHWSNHLKKIQKKAGSHRVRVKVKNHNSPDGKHKISFRVKGKKPFVKEVLEDIAQTYCDILSKLPKCIAQNRGPQRGTVDFIRHAAGCEEDCPSYWNFFKNFEPDQITSHNRKQDWLVDISPKLTEKIATFVLTLFDGEMVGTGQDAKGLDHSRIKINKIQRVEHPGLFRKYSACRKQLFEKVGNQRSPCLDIAKVKFSSGCLATCENLPRFMKSELYHEINEKYLFHGTGAMHTIINNGPDFRMGSSDGLFGRGFYMAERTTKADQYADRRDQRTPHGTELTMIMFRALLGNVFVCNKEHPSVKGEGSKLCRPPCMKCLKDRCKCIGQSLFDSVMSEGWLFREFVVYDKDTCYPEYVIFYRRK